MAQETLQKIGVFVSLEVAERLDAIAAKLHVSTSAAARLVLDLGVVEAEKRVDVLTAKVGQ